MIMSTYLWMRTSTVYTSITCGFVSHGGPPQKNQPWSSPYLADCCIPSDIMGLTSW